MTRRAWAVMALLVGLSFVIAAALAPEFLSEPVLARANATPLTAPPLGADDRGVPLLEYALQGAAITVWPAAAAGLLVGLVAALAGILRCTGQPWVDVMLHGLLEVVGALPRMVVVLVVALLIPHEGRSLWPVALTWACLAAPTAMDEAASVAGRLGAERFVEALRAHGFSWPRIYLWHVIGLNLRPLLVRQAAEVGTQVVFLEIALSYLTLARSEPALTHGDGAFSWASLLAFGYQGLLGAPLLHALFVGLGLMAMVAWLGVSVRRAASPR